MIWGALNIPQAALLKLMIVYTWEGCLRESLEVPKGSQATCLYDVDRGVVIEAMQGKLASSQFNFGYTEQFSFLRWLQCSSRLVTVLLGTLWSSIKQIEVPYVFDWENAIALDTMLGNRASSRGEKKVSWVFSSCGRNLRYILELRRGSPFETGVCSGKSGHLSKYEGQPRNVN